MLNKDDQKKGPKTHIPLHLAHWCLKPLHLYFCLPLHPTALVKVIQELYILVQPSPYLTDLRYLAELVSNSSLKPFLSLATQIPRRPPFPDMAALLRVMC